MYAAPFHNPKVSSNSSSGISSASTLAPHKFHPAAPPPHPARTGADAHAHSAPPRSGVQITPRRSALRAPCLCSRPLWRSALPASRCLPPASGSPHRCSESSALNSETPPPIAALPMPETHAPPCARPSPTFAVCCSSHTHRAPYMNTLPKSCGRTSHSAPAQTRAPECHTPKTSAGRARRMLAPDTVAPRGKVDFRADVFARYQLFSSARNSADMPASAASKA